MLGHTIQYLLHAIAALCAVLSVAGVILAVAVRRGSADVDILKIPLVGLSMIAAAAPYVGLTGTVWHIIQALGGIGAGNLNVAAIAKPIGEALYATLWGLCSAIPAMVFHRLIVAMLPEEDETGGETGAALVPAPASAAIPVGAEEA